MKTVKIITRGRTQAVRIPKEYRFHAEEVYINKLGDALIITPIEKLPKLYEEGLREFTGDFMVDGRPEEIPSERLGLQ